jgi:hypothetical protein
VSPLRLYEISGVNEQVTGAACNRRANLTVRQIQFRLFDCRAI